MVRYGRIMAAVTLLLLMGWTLMGTSAAAEEVYTVSPRQIDMGAFTGPPPADGHSRSFAVAVIAGPDNDPDTDNAFFAQADVPWISVSSSRGTVPAALTVTVAAPSNLSDGDYTGNIRILSETDLDRSVSIPVFMTVNSRVWDELTVSPTRLDLTVNKENPDEQAFPVTIMNANPDLAGFSWSGYADVPWLGLSRNTGTGNTTITLTVDPKLLILTEDLDGDGLLDGGRGTVTFRSKLNDTQIDDPVTLTVTLSAVLPGELSISPEQLFWSVEKGDDALTIPWDPQYLQIFSGPAGWTASVDTHLVSLKSLDRVNVDGEFKHEPGFAGAGPYDTLLVTPVAEYLQTAVYGTHSGTITITDRSSGDSRQIPVVINIRRPGEPVIANPHYSVIETSDAGNLHLLLPIPDSFAYYPTQMSCRGAGGNWIDPDGVPGNLDEHCSLNERAYVLMKFPEMMPDTVYAWDRYGQFSPAFVNGVKIPGADYLTYADGPVSVIPVGPAQLLDYHGTMVVSVRLGATLDNARELQRIQINIRTLAGQWRVTESYFGIFYTYDRANLLHLAQNPAQGGYAGTWGGIPVTVVPGDGAEVLHYLYFSYWGINYIYEIQTVSATRMTGRWRFTWMGGGIPWNRFTADRVTTLP
jgi:hypothetical protein